MPRTPDVTCPPNESASIVRLNVGVGTINGLNASCTLDPTTGTTVATSSVSDARLLGGLITIGLATVFFNETTTNAAGEFVQNAIRVRVPPILLIPGQEIILAGCRLG